MTVNISNQVRILLAEYLRSSSEILRTGGRYLSTVVATLCQVENVELTNCNSIKSDINKNPRICYLLV